MPVAWSGGAILHQPGWRSRTTQSGGYRNRRLLVVSLKTFQPAVGSVDGRGRWLDRSATRPATAARTRIRAVAPARSGRRRRRPRSGPGGRGPRWSWAGLRGGVAGEALAGVGGAEAVAQAGQAAVGPGLDRARGDAEQAGDVGLGQVEVVAQDDGGPLARREVLEGLPQDQVVAGEVGLVAVIGGAGDQGAGLDHGPAEQGPVTVEQDLAGVGGRAVVAPDPGPDGVGAGHRVLGQLLGLVPVAGEQEPDPPQGPELGGEELQEVRVVSSHVSYTRPVPSGLRWIRRGAGRPARPTTG